ncbi:glycosyltransferase [Arthrobacter sp. A5]|uniref:glycosyltransferase n=1 Tax=Arthrobacter sp. A5 TaxID=576926 RepID=UPI003DAA10EF
MTSALLRRSRAFVRESGVDVDVLTFEYDNGYEDVRCELEASGELISGMRLRNLWEELATYSDEELRTAQSGKEVKGIFRPIPGAEISKEEITPDALGRRIREDAAGQGTLQIDYLRPDGTIFVSDQRDLNEFGTEGGRRITLCDNGGHPVAAWNQMWPLYLFWLDTVTGARETYMIVDSKSTANFITRFRRDHVVTLHMVHNSHMASGQVPPHGELSSVRRYVFERLNTYDGIVLLTARQKEDVDIAFDGPDNTFVVPNSTELPPALPTSVDRMQHHGVMLASLTRRKRVDHAIRGIAAANAVSAEPFQLTIYGQGPERDALTGVISQANMQDCVELAGYDDEPRKRLESASFVLLTSRMEGLPLVLLEAMSVGCIPIAYDMPYGPADIIVDGVNGFLVKAGDVAALADSIIRQSRLDPEQLENMRGQARQTAEQFNDRSVTAQWGRVMQAAVDIKLTAIAAANSRRSAKAAE